MFVFNIKLKSKKNLLIFSVLVSVVIAVICFVSAISGERKVPDVATCDEVGEYSLVAETEQEQCDFLAQLGYEADKEIDSRNVLIPSEFNSAYEEYNILQKKIGLDLSRFKGKTAREIKIELKNTDKEYAVLLVYDGKVIGGHITNGEYGSKNEPLI